MWSGMVNCFQCGNPIIHEEEVIPTFRDDICGLPATCITAVDADTLFTFRVRVSQGRIARGFQFNITYRVKLPSTNVLTSSLTTGRRSYRKQAERWDQHIVIAHRNKVRSGEYQEGTVESAIDADHTWRMELANRLLRCNLDFSPAQILRSKYCRYAFEKAIELEELSRENIGHRTRTAVVAMDVDEDE